jgi:hypothetical protein
MMIALDREFLAIALKFNLGEIRLEDELSAMLFSNGGKRMVIMPVRMSVEPTQPAPAPVPVPATSPESTAAPTTAAQSTITEPKPDAAAEPKENAMNATTLQAPERANLKSNGNGTTTKPAETTPPTLIDQIEQIKESVRNVGRDLNNLIEAVKTAEKQQRATEREVESARATLKKLQQVTI